jgi:hypothetical protein
MRNPFRGSFKEPALKITGFLEKNGTWVILILILGISLLYNYPETLLKRPQSTHYWRQCDGASLALNYYQEGMHFFKPATHGLYSDNSTTGYTAPSEIPILYYFAALLYKLFGYHDYIFRALNLFLFYLGLFYLYKFAFEVLKNFFYSTAVVLFLFSSPLIVYYANNFLPNTVGLAFTIMGWYYFYQYSQSKNTRTFLISVLFFGLASAMKITELASPLIIMTLLLADRFNFIHLDLAPRKHLFVKLSAIMFIFLFAAGWVFYAKWYNHLHNSSQFSTFIFPIWNLDRETIKNILINVHKIWFKEYFMPFTGYLLPGCALILLIKYRKVDKLLGLSALALFSWMFVFILLWFYGLADHDYFLIGLYILPVIVVILFFKILVSLNIKKIFKTLIQCLVMLFLIWNIAYARERQHIRYYSWMNDFEEMKDVYDIAPYLDKIGIHQQDTLVFYPSPNIRPLYLMNRRGWTINDHDNLSLVQMMSCDTLIQEYIRKGAKYLITNDIHSAISREWLLPYTKDLVFKKGSIYIFKAPPIRENFVPSDTSNPTVYNQ